MASTKSPSKYTSLARLQAIAANWYRGADGQDYEASEVDALIIAKADKLTDEVLADHYDFCDDYEAHLEQEYQHEIADSLLLCDESSCGDGTLPAGAFADWSALVAAAATKIYFAVTNFFAKKGQSMKKAYIIANGKPIAEVATDCKNGAIIRYGYIRVTERINASRDWSLVNAHDAKISRAKRWGSFQLPDRTAVEIYPGEFFIS
jgi:hypothetical protein